jgi:hypothetical protein
VDEAKARAAFERAAAGTREAFGDFLYRPQEILTFPG